MARRLTGESCRLGEADRSAREACRALLVHVNSRNPNQSLLALSVIEHLVRNCGYPMHLQISTKEFLNELVRRFPERPPMVTGRVMGRILEVSYVFSTEMLRGCSTGPCYTVANV